MRDETMIEAINDIDSIRCMVEDIHEEITNTPDYWTRLEHQYAGMAMQGLVRTVGHDRMYPPEKIAIYAVACATALVEKLKEGK